MNKKSSNQWRKELVLGLWLIGIGLAFLADQIGLFDIHDIWHYWPLILVVVGVNKIVGFVTAKHITEGLWFVFAGLWLFANFEHLFGLSFRNSWPMLIIASGVCIVLEPLIKSRIESHTESDNEK